MPLSLIGWLNGGSAALSVIFGLLYGIILLIKSRKLKGSNLVPVVGFNSISVGLLWLGPATDFLTILITGKNMDNSFGLYGLLSYIWTGPAIITAIYLGANIMNLKYKKSFLIITLIIVFFFEFSIFTFTMQSFEFTKPNGDNITDSNFVPGSMAFFLIAIIILLEFFFGGIGALIESIKTAGEIKKRLRFFSAAYIIFTIVAVCDTVVSPGPILFLIRVNMIPSAILLYNSVKPKEFLKKSRTAKSSNINELNSPLIETLYKSKPSQITEQEVSFYREQKICLVCKGTVSRLNYICPKCSALYCIKCSETLSELENMCWVCQTPFDESKPVKPYKKEEETKIGVESAKNKEKKELKQISTS